MQVVYGGSFNPPTLAHLAIIEYLATRYEKLIVIPNGKLYVKNGLIDFNHRIEMLKIITNRFDNIEISYIETERNFLGTFQSLRELGHPLFACGDDCLEQFHSWINPEALLTENKFLIFTRNFEVDVIYDRIKNNSLLAPYFNKFTVVKLDLPNVSSSNFRKTYDKNQLDSEVYEYIVKNNLYK